MTPFRIQELHGPGLHWDGPAWLIHWPLEIAAAGEAARHWHDQALAAVEREFPRLTRPPTAAEPEPEASAADLVIAISRRILTPAPVDLHRPREGVDAPEGLRIATCLQHELAGNALKLAQRMITSSWLQPQGGETQPVLQAHLATLQKQAKICCEHSLTMEILREARQRGIPQRLIDPEVRLYQLGSGDRAHWINGTASDRDSKFGCEIAQDKKRTNQLLRNLGLPVPRQLCLPVACRDSDLARAAAQIGYPCVLKPADRDQGRGVVVGIESEEHLLQAAQETRQQANRRLVIEELIPGNDIRLFMLNGSLAWAIERVPPSITGDGIHTVSALIATANQHRQKLRALDGISGLIPIDAETLNHLQRARQDLDSVLPAGQVIQLRNNANVSTGGLFQVVTDQVHPEIRRQCETIAASLRLAAAGIDYLCRDISQPPSQCPGAFLEVNWMPQASTKKAGVVLNGLFPANSRHSMHTSVVIARFEAEALVPLRQRLMPLLATDPALTLACPRRLTNNIAALTLPSTCRQRAYEHPREILMDASESHVLFLIDSLNLLWHGLPVTCPDRVLFWTENPLQNPKPWVEFQQRMQVHNEPQNRHTLV